MSFASYETSVANGRPTQLFEFTYSGETWRYTSGDEPVTLNGVTYIPAVVYCESIPGVIEATRANVSVMMSRALPVPNLFRVSPPSEVVTCCIYQIHYNDGDAQAVAVWRGRITNCEWQGVIVNMNTESVFTSLLRNGLGPRYSLQCTAAIYGPRCGVINSAYKTTGTVISMNGLTVTINETIGKGANYFVGGYATWVNYATGSVELRFIEQFDSVTGAVTLGTMPVGLNGGMSVDVYPGCDHMLETCDAKFHNALNYKGMPFIPTVNPFGGVALY